MANKNQVTLTFAGDTSDLERSVSRVGQSTRDLGDSFDRVGEGADTADTRAMGFRDTITGIQDINRGLTGDFDSIGDQLVTLGMGFGDLASGVANFGAQFARQTAQFVANCAKQAASMAVTVAKTVAGWVLMGAQAMINAARMAAAWLISLGPVGLVIAAIAAIIAILVALGVGFDDLKRWAQAAWDFILGVVQGVFNWIKDNWPLILAILTGPIGLAVLAIVSYWDTIKNAFTAVKDWIGARVTDIVGFITGLPGRIASAAVGMFNGITNAFKSAINAIIGMWNNFSISFGGYDIPGPGPNIPSFTIDTPNIPYLAEGGLVTRPTLAMIGEAGPEAVLPLNRMGGMGTGEGVTVNLYVQGSIRSDRDLVRLIRDEFDRGGFRVA